MMQPSNSILFAAAMFVTELMMTMISLPLAITLLYVLLRDRTHSGSFFTIYKACYVGLTYDIFSLVFIHLIGVFPTHGMLLSEEFMETQTYLIVYHFFNYAIHFCQAITNTLICFNRATVVLFPTSHDKIWNSRFLLPSCFILQIVAPCLVGWRSLQYEMYLMHYSTGERFSMVIITPDVREFFNSVSIAAAGSCAYLFLLYSLVIFKFRMTLRKLRTKADPADAKRTFSLLCIAVTVVVWEILYFIFYWNLFVKDPRKLKIDFRVQYSIYFCLFNLYSSLPSYLLVCFYKPVRDQVKGIVLNAIRSVRKSSSDSTVSVTRAVPISPGH